MEQSKFSAPAFSPQSYSSPDIYHSRITDYTFLGSDRLATYSSLDNHLLITDLNSGATLFSEKKAADPTAIVEGLTETKDS
jgi:hypothetical protein